MCGKERMLTLGTWLDGLWPTTFRDTPLHPHEHHFFLTQTCATYHLTVIHESQNSSSSLVLHKDENSTEDGGSRTYTTDRGTYCGRRSSWIGSRPDAGTERMGRYNSRKKTERRGFRDPIMYAYTPLFARIHLCV
jgi:hypothetical protein